MNQIRFLRFAGTLTLVNGASLISPTGGDITTAPGDTAIALSDASGGWTVRHYARANGYPLVTPLVFSGNTGAATVPAGSTRYFTIGNVGTAVALVYVPMGRRGRFKNLRVVTSSAPGTNESLTFTLQKLFSDSALTCTIAGAGSKQASDLVDSVLFEASDRWCIKVVASANAPAFSNILSSLLLEAID